MSLSSERWDHFHSAFPFNDLALAYLDGDGDMVMMCLRCYEAIRIFYFESRLQGHIGRVMYDIEFPHGDWDENIHHRAADVNSRLLDIHAELLERFQPPDPQREREWSIYCDVNLGYLLRDLANSHIDSEDLSSASDVATYNRMHDEHSITDSDSGRLREINRVSSIRLNERRAKRVCVHSASVSPTAVGTSAKCELDTRADTIVAGINCRPIISNGQTCEVKGFHSSFDAISNVPVSTVATAWTNPQTGATYVLIFNEALYFGEQMDHSLINPNQLRAFGVPVWDNPFDPDHQMGIEHGELLIPFQTAGSTVFCTTHYPSDEELESCQQLVLSSDME